MKKKVNRHNHKNHNNHHKPEGFEKFMASEGKFIQYLVHPLIFEFKLKDILQVIVGATILAVPVGFTEETWNLGGSLPFANVIGILFISLLFISAFTYYHYYRGHMQNHWTKFTKRVILTYIFSFIVVGLIMFLIQRAPIHTDILLSFKRIVIVTLPASMSATVADTMK